MADQDPASARITRNYAQLLSLAVHEFRTPASVVGGYLRMLQRDQEAPLPDRQRKMVEEAEKSCARMVALVGEMNEVARLDDLSVPLQQEPLDFFALVREVGAEAKESEERGVRLKVRGATGSATLKGDTVRLHGALAAIFRAVLREQPDKSLVIVDCQQKRDVKPSLLTLIVAKDDQVAEAVAAPPSAFDEKRGGLGLALPIARRVLERHGGRIWSPPAEKGEYGSRGAVLLSLPLS